MPTLEPFVLTIVLAGTPLDMDAAARDIGQVQSRSPFEEIFAPVPRSEMQIRVEQRIVIRVPRRSVGRMDLSSSLPSVLKTRRYKAKKSDKCVVMSQVAGVHLWNDDSLILYMRDDQLFQLELDKTCRAKDFYQGFYMVKSSDGMLCAERDVLQARSGSKCAVEEMRQMEAVKDD